MIETLTEIDDLKRQKELIWDALLGTAWGSPEEEKVRQQYVDICRKILRMERAK